MLIRGSYLSIDSITSMFVVLSVTEGSLCHIY